MDIRHSITVGFPNSSDFRRSDFRHFLYKDTFLNVGTLKGASFTIYYIKIYTFYEVRDGWLYVK